MMDWEKAKKRARKIASNPALTQTLVNQAFEKTQKNPRFLQDARRDLRLLLRMVKAQAKGLYRLPWSRILLAVGVIIYFVNPMDAVPDFLIGPGLLDDAALLAMVFRTLRKDLDEFAIWEQEKRGDHET